MIIVPFSKRYDRTAFECSSPELDAYLKTRVSADIKRDVTACFLAVRDEEIVGYYTLCSGGVILENVPPSDQKKLPRYPDVSIVRMGRLAVASACQGQGLGSVLLVDAMKRACRSELAWWAFGIDPKDDRAAAFYEHFGFIWLESRASMFLPRKTIRNL